MNKYLHATIPAILGVLLVLPRASASQDTKQCDQHTHFGSERDAVIAALNAYNPRSIEEDREYMGAIFAERGRFRFSVVAGSRRKDNVTLRVAGSEWERVTAFWHTHGDARPSNRYFSAKDTDLVNRFNKPLYLGDYTGYVKRYSPGDPRLNTFAARRLGLPARPGYAVGEVLRDDNNRFLRIRTRLTESGPARRR